MTGDADEETIGDANGQTVGDANRQTVGDADEEPTGDDDRETTGGDDGEPTGGDDGDPTDGDADERAPEAVGEKTDNDGDWEAPEDLESVRNALIEWYEADHRSLPWRETTDPYAILVSEVMSQQTQLDRVEPAWEAFLDRWPTTEALAAADRAAVVGFWTDHRLGYNNRAKYLHEAARQVETTFEGSIPETPTALQELSGVGPYTANAVASFAFDAGDAVVDTNVKRVTHRAFAVPDDDGAFERAANRLMPSGRSRVWNNAIMELGGVICGKTPRCDEAACPWRAWCRAYETGDFTAPDVPTQPAFEGSRRQFRGRVIRTLGEYDELPVDTLGHRIRVDYATDGEDGREWLLDLLSDLAGDDLVTVARTDDDRVAVARLRR